MATSSALYPALQRLRQIDRQIGMVIKYCPLKAPSWTQRQILLDPWNPILKRALYEYSQVPDDELSWCVIANTAAKALPKAVLRERVRRRVAAALAEAMRRQGYHRNGKRLNPSADKKPVPDLKGTMEMYIYTGDQLHEGFESLVTRAGRVLNEIRHPRNQKVVYDKTPPATSASAAISIFQSSSRQSGPSLGSA